jgi:flagellar biosynthesis chaperone FliJ
METRVAAVRQLIERRLDERSRAVAVGEQKASDELATIAAWRAARGLNAAALA